MKKLINLIACLALASFMFSCDLLAGLTDEKTEQQLQAELLEGSWNVESIEINTIGSVSDRFPDFGITFSLNEDLTGGEISVDGDLVPNTDARLIGTTINSEWSFVGSSLTQINISDREGNSDNFEIEIDETGTSLTLIFDYEKPENRTQGLVGTYIIELSR